MTSDSQESATNPDSVSSGTTGRPNPSEIIEQRDRILASAPFANSKRMRDFLDYLVRESLGEEPPRLKEFAIGVAVFGRDESFDPRVDSVVRVEAIRLRGKLREYYGDAGRDDRVIITIPKGGYIPHYALVDDGQAANSSHPTPTAGLLRAGRAWFWACMCIATAASFWLSVRPSAIAFDNGEGPAAHSIAVLPVKEWSGSEDDYFSEALTDVLIGKLSRQKALRVTSLASVMNYRDSDLPPSVIADRLGVQNILTGTVYRDQGQIRITANLINADAERVIWSHSYTRPLDGVLSLQDEIATAISGQLVGELLSVEQVPAKEVNPLAYEAFLKGVYWRNRLTEQGFKRGILFFRQAIEMQPDFADAYAAMAASHCRLAGHGVEVVQPDASLPQAWQFAARALELDDSLAEAFAVMGIISFKYEWDSDAATAYLNRALAENPSLFEAHLWRSQVSEGTGKHELAVSQARMARRLSPLSLVGNLNLGWQLFQAGQYVEAEVEFDNLLQFDPDFWGGHWGKGHIYRRKGMFDDAIAEFSRALELGGGHTMVLASLGYTYAVAGMRPEALDVVDRLHEIAENIYVSPMDFATVYAGLNEPDSVFAWLDRAYEVRARSVAWLTVREEFAGLRDDPRFAALVASVGVTAEGPRAEFL